MAKKRATVKNNEEENLDDIYADLAAETGGDVLDELDTVDFFIDTGNLAVNYSCSGKFMNGGIPGGRITEAFGPEASGKSLFASNVLYGAQRMDAWCVLLDCENASNGEFMERVSHLNLKRVIRYTPSSLERAFRQIHVVANRIREREIEAAKAAKKSVVHKPIVVIFDSLTVPPCERELRENDLPLDFSVAEWKKLVGAKEQPGERAKVISAAMRKLQAAAVKLNITCYIINQTRDKIGVMYGCFHYNNRVVLADGSTMKIGKIVNQNMVGLEVLSFNPDNGKIEPKKITKCHNNGNLEDGESFLQFKVNKFRENGLSQFSCTSNHMIFKKSDSFYEEVSAGSLKIGDKVLVTQPFYLNSDQMQVVYGSILGDGSLRKIKRSCAQLRICHGIEQEGYCSWKEELMNPWIGHSYVHENYKRVGFDTIPMCELTDLLEYKEDYYVPEDVINNLDLLGLAIWYMDDGTYRPAEKWGKGQAKIYCTKFKNREDLKVMLGEKFGLDCWISSVGFHFNAENTRKLHEIVSPYIHPSMDYKLHNSLRNQFKYEIDEPNGAFRYEPIESEIFDIYEKPPTRSKRKFDLTIEDNHSYVVDGVIVHNSPETTPGGNAMKFYASLRFRTQSKKKIEHRDLGIFSGINLQVRNVKNRTFRPFTVADDVKLYFDEGIDPISGLLVPLIQDGKVIQKTGGNYEVAPDCLPEGFVTYKFKARKADNRIPLKVLLECPKLIGAEDAQQVQDYMDVWGSGLAASESGSYGQKTVSFDAEGNLFEADTFDDEVDDE